MTMDTDALRQALMDYYGDRPKFCVNLQSKV